MQLVSTAVTGDFNGIERGDGSAKGLGTCRSYDGVFVIVRCVVSAVDQVVLFIGAGDKAQKQERCQSISSVNP